MRGGDTQGYRHSDVWSDEMLLVVAIAVAFGSESRWTRNNVLLSTTQTDCKGSQKTTLIFFK